MNKTDYIEAKKNVEKSKDQPKEQQLQKKLFLFLRKF